MILGIDLGTTYSACSYFDGQRAVLIPNSTGAVLTASVVYLGEGDKFVVGDCPNPEEFPTKFCFFKEYMGTKKQFLTGGRSFSPVELSAMVLQQLKADAERFLGEPVTEAVISVPAYFSDKQRVATKQAGELAGLHTARIVNEPSAAALAYQFGFDESSILVFDFGGGTIDVSVVDCFDNIIEIRAIAGDNHMGGKDVDQLLVDYFCSVSRLSPNSEEQEILRTEMELLKETLSQVPQILYEFGGKAVMFDRTLLASICQPLFQKLGNLISKAMWDGEKDPNEIDAVILVGGSSHLQGLAEYLEDIMGITPICSIHPQTVVAMGMGYYVGMKSRDEAVKDLILTDVCPFSLGVSSVHGGRDVTPHMTALIPRNSTLPATETANFVTVSDNQDQIVLKVLQGEHYLARDNDLLGTIPFDLPPAPAGQESIQVCFTYDLNGILQVEVNHLSSGRQTVTALSSTAHQELSEETLAESMERLSHFRLATMAEEEELLQRANGMYALLPPKERNLVGKFLAEYRSAKAMVEERKLQRKINYLLCMLQQWNNLRFSSPMEQTGFASYFQDHIEEGFSIEEFFPEEDG